jgi:hypothetical protein
MAKSLVTLCCLLAMGAPVLAGGETDNDAKALPAVYGTADQENAEDLVQTVQWSGSGRTWTCVARGRGGRTFLGQSRNANTARRIALNRCWNRSSGCVIRSCR